MKLRNKTNFDTVQLKAFIRQVAAKEELTPADIAKFRVTARYRRRSAYRADDCPGGWAYYNTWTFSLSFVRGVMPDKAKLAKVIGHELAHCQGVRHRHMQNNRYGWPSDWEQYWAWARELPLTMHGPTKPPTRDEKISASVAHCESMLAQWQRKVKLAATKAAYWKRKLRYYEKRQAAAPADNAESEVSE